jgi:hypothetical protein
MLFDTGDAIGDGCISNISDTGALIECADKAKPAPGASVLLAIKLGSAHLRINASVARLTETGFAVAFVDLGRTGREVLDVLLQPSPVVERSRS